MPPPGLRTPQGDIGSLWASTEGLREAVGFAQTDEQEIGINVQRYESGSFLLDVSIGQFFGLGNDGAAYGPFQLPDNLPTPIAPSDLTLTPLGPAAALTLLAPAEALITPSPADQPPPLATTAGS